MHMGWKSRVGVSSDFASGGQCFPDKIAWEIPYFLFYYIFIHKLFENLPVGVLCYTSFPLPSLVCIYGPVLQNLESAQVIIFSLL